MSRRKISPWLAVTLFIVSGMGLVLPTHAHHSSAMFDKATLLKLKGVVRKIEWKNPHVYFFVDVQEKGAVKQYAIECGSPNMLSRMGWKISTVKVGDTVTLAVFPIRDGQPAGLIDTLTLADGRVIKGV